MTPQEIFDTVVTHLFSMKERSIDGEGKCAYRGVNNSKCVVGILIPDEIYTPDMEGLSALSLCKIEEFKLPEWIIENRFFLLYLQGVHDNYLNWGEYGPNEFMIDKLYEIAKEYNLNDDIIKGNKS